MLHLSDLGLAVIEADDIYNILATRCGAHSTGVEYEDWWADELLGERTPRVPGNVGNDVLEMLVRPRCSDVVQLLIEDDQQKSLWAREFKCADIDVEAFEGESPFKFLIEHETPKRTHKRLVDVIRNTSVRTDGEVIAKRLETIEAAQEQDEIEVNVESLRQLAKFLLENNQLQTPDIVITNRGNYRVQWQKAANKHFAMEFFPAGDVKFVCFRINRANPTKISRYSGLTTVDEIVDGVMIPTESQGWILEKG